MSPVVYACCFVMIWLFLAGCNQDAQMEHTTPMVTPTTINRFSKVPEYPPEVRLVLGDAAAPTLFGPLYLGCIPDADGYMESHGTNVRWDAIPRDMYEEGFVTVWAQWLFIPEDKYERPATVSATWVFHFINE